MKQTLFALPPTLLKSNEDLEADSTFKKLFKTYLTSTEALRSALENSKVDSHTTRFFSGCLARLESRNEQALQHFESLAKDLSQEQTLYWLTLMQTAACLLETGKTNRARRTLEFIAANAPDHSDLLGECHSRLAVLAHQSGQMESALKYYTSALRHLVASNRKELLCDVLSNRGIYFAQIGEYRLSRASLMAAYHQAARNQFHRLKANILLNLGRIQIDQKEWDEAKVTYVKIIRLTERLQQPSERALAHSMLGMVHYHTGEYNLALEFLQKAIQQSDALSKDEICEAYLFISRTLLETGKPHEAKKTAEKAHLIGTEDSLLALDVEVHELMIRTQEAKNPSDYFELTKTIEPLLENDQLEEGQKALLAAQSAILEYKNGHQETARAAAARAIKLAGFTGDAFLKARVFEELGVWMNDRNRYLRAAANYQDAGTIQRERNVLQNLVEWDDDLLTEHSTLPKTELQILPSGQRTSPGKTVHLEELKDLSLSEAVETFKREFVAFIIERSENREEVSRKLGIKGRTLRYHLKRLSISKQKPDRSC